MLTLDVTAMLISITPLQLASVVATPLPRAPWLCRKTAESLICPSQHAM